MDGATLFSKHLVTLLGKGRGTQIGTQEVLCKYEKYIIYCEGDRSLNKLPRVIFGVPFSGDIQNLLSCLNYSRELTLVNNVQRSLPMPKIL